MRPIYIALVLIFAGKMPAALAAESTTANSNANSANANSVQFSSLLNSLLGASPEVIAQSATVESARRESTSKSLYWTPTASASLKNTSYEGQSTDYRTSSISANLNLFRFGGSELARRGADAKLQAEQSRLQFTTEERETYISGLLFQYIRETKNIDLREKNIKLKEDSLRVAEEKYKQGQLPGQELEKVRIELENVKVAYNEALLNQINVAAKIKSIADVSLSSITWPFENLLSSSWAPKGKLKNPQDFYDVKTYQFEKNYFQNKAKEAIRSGYLPTLDLVSAWSNNSWSENKGGYWTTSLVLTIPLWDQLSGASISAAYNSSATRSALNENFTLRQMKDELSTLSQRTDLIRQNVLSSKKGVEKLAELRSDSLRRFKLGRSSVNDLLLDENRYLDAETALLNSMYAFHLIIIENCHKRGELLTNCMR